MKSQCKLILEYLRDHVGITPKDAIENFGCYRLSARIADLRQMGYKIETIQRTVKHSNGRVSRFAEYRLVGGK